MRGAAVHQESNSVALDKTVCQLEPSAAKNVTGVVIEVGVQLLVTVDTRGALDRIEMVTVLPFDDAVLLSENIQPKSL